jgi:hypothetical protein
MLGVLGQTRANRALTAVRADSSLAKFFSTRRLGPWLLLRDRRLRHLLPPIVISCVPLIPIAISCVPLILRR